MHNSKVFSSVLFSFFSTVRAMVSQANTSSHKAIQLPFSLSIKYVKSISSLLGFLIFIVLPLNG